MLAAPSPRIAKVANVEFTLNHLETKYLRGDNKGINGA